MKQALRLFVLSLFLLPALFLSGCSHIDVDKEALTIADDNESSLDLSDPQFPEYLDESDVKDAVVSYNDGVLAEIENRKRIQNATRNEFAVFKDFSFENKQKESGINFRHYMVDDTGIEFQFDHYDHGNGLAVADVDGDGLLDIYFVTQVGQNQLWRNKGEGKFENITERAGVGLRNKMSVSASFADIDNDGDADLYVTSVRHGNTMFENDGTGKFKDISSESGLDYIGHSSAAVFFDYNLDGLLDMFLVNVGGYTKDEIGRYNYYIGNPAAFQHTVVDSHTEDSVMYKNLGNNKFEDITEKVGLVNNSWSGDAIIVDLNNDRYPDLYVLSMEGDDHYYENNQGKSFTDKTDSFFPRTSNGAMGGKFFDYNNDLNTDLYTTDMHSDMGFKDSMTSLDKELLKSDDITGWDVDTSRSIYGNSFYHNSGDGNFNEVSAKLNLENYWPWGISVGDINADGYDDIFVTASMNYLYKYVPNKMMLNNNGKKFLNAEYLLGIEPRLNNEIEKMWFNLDCKRRNKDHLECMDRSGEVSQYRGDEVTVMGSLGSRSSVMFDIDGDGDLDIITNDFNDEPLVLVSNLSDQIDINYLEVSLVGNKSNKDGLGATVTVFAGDDTYTKYNDGVSGYLSHSRMSLYFGLGTHESIDKIIIDWPSGQQTLIDQVDEIKRVLTISE